MINRSKRRSSSKKVTQLLAVFGVSNQINAAVLHTTSGNAVESTNDYKLQNNPSSKQVYDTYNDYYNSRFNQNQNIYYNDQQAQKPTYYNRAGQPNFNFNQFNVNSNNRRKGSQGNEWGNDYADTDSFYNYNSYAGNLNADSQYPANIKNQQNPFQAQDSSRRSESTNTPQHSDSDSISDSDSGTLPKSPENIFSEIAFSLTENDEEEPEGSGYGSDEINTAHMQEMQSGPNGDSSDNQLRNHQSDKINNKLGHFEEGRRADVDSIENLMVGGLRPQFNKLPELPLPELPETVLKFNKKSSKSSESPEENKEQDQEQDEPKSKKVKVIEGTASDLLSKKEKANHQASTGSSTDKWNEEDCYINGFSRCLNGGICSSSMKRCFCASGFTGDRCQFQNCDAADTLVNGTCSSYDLLMVKVKTPGIARMVKELGIPLRELSSKSATSLGARDVLREHVFDKLMSKPPSFLLQRAGSASALIAELEEEQAQNSPKFEKLVSEDAPKAEALRDINSNSDFDHETIGISVEWFDLGKDDIEAKLKLSLPLGSGHDMKKWETLLKNALIKSPVLDANSLEVSDFDECNTEINRCNSKLNTICENLIGSYQCRCLPDPKTGLPSEKCQDPCLRADGQPICGNYGRCSPILAAQKSIQYKNSYNMAGASKKYAYLEERVENIYDMNTQPTCSCVEGFYGETCEFIRQEDNSVLVTVWVISAILFIIIIMFLGRKIYDLSCGPSVDLSGVSSGSSSGVNRNGSFLTAGNSVYGNTHRNTTRSGYTNNHQPNHNSFNERVQDYNNQMNQISANIVAEQRVREQAMSGVRPQNNSINSQNSQQSKPQTLAQIYAQPTISSRGSKPNSINLQQVPQAQSGQNNGQGFVFKASFDDNRRVMNSQKSNDPNPARHIYAYY